MTRGAYASGDSGYLVFRNISKAAFSLTLYEFLVETNTQSSEAQAKPSDVTAGITGRISSPKSENDKGEQYSSIS